MLQQPQLQLIDEYLSFSLEEMISHVHTAAKSELDSFAPITEHFQTILDALITTLQDSKVHLMYLWRKRSLN